MPLQNRVDPWGNLIAIHARGFWLGNRGILHNDEQRIVRNHAHKSWVICQLNFKGRQRKVFSPNHYSELFFLDEVTALAAGHRPCAECQRRRFNEFKQLWLEVNWPNPELNHTPVSKIDKWLHQERINKNQLYPFAKLPTGAFFEHENQPLLNWHNVYYLWTAYGYIKTEINLDPTVMIRLITPLSTVNILKSGFIPQVHESIESSC